MNIKDFLTENYIYIIIIIVLVIITIIGFLADKKKNSEKRPNTMGGNIQNPGMGGNNMAYQPQQNINGPINYMQPNSVMGSNNMQYNQAVNNPPVTPLPTVPMGQENSMVSPTNNNMFSPMPTTMTPIQEPMTQPATNPINEMNYNAPGPVEPMNAMTNNQPESLYQPLSEQKPSFAPVDPTINVMNNQMTSGVSEPMNMQPTPVPEFNTPIGSNQMNNMNMAQATMPNQMPTPIPASPMPNQGGNTVPNPITPPQPVSPQPINFTYGNQNNNQFMQ